MNRVDEATKEMEEMFVAMKENKAKEHVIEFHRNKWETMIERHEEERVLQPPPAEPAEPAADRATPEVTHSKK